MSMEDITKQLNLPGAKVIEVKTAFQDDLLALMRRHNIPLCIMCLVQRDAGGAQLKAIIEYDKAAGLLDHFSQTEFNQGFGRPMLERFRRFLDTGKFEGE